MKKKEIEEYLPIDLSQYLAETYAQQNSQKEKKLKGQYFTPNNIAEFMASCITIHKEEVSILDPGCGTLTLSCALIQKLVNDGFTKVIKLDVYETDLELISYINEIILVLKKYIEDKNIDFIYNIYMDDFVLANAKYLASTTNTFYDIIISNPPYFKLNKSDQRAIAANIINAGQPNIYALFMAISSRLLSHDGEMIFITPRSFTSGLYFKKFRQYFLDNVNIASLHLFSDRNTTFKKDNILQELVITKALKHKVEEVIITSSDSQLNISFNKSYPYKDIYNIENNNSFIFIPINDEEEQILTITNKWNHTLEDFGFTISTGPVVDFRTKENILFSDQTQTNIIPYYRLNNVMQMHLQWPLHNLNKEQYILQNNATQSILRPNKNYVFLRRQSAKGDKHRLIATPYIKHGISENIGIDNKLNYIYSKHRDLKIEEVYGIAALLNSSFMNQYFQIFNGNTNVSATEIKQLKLPNYNLILELGKLIINSNNISFEHINQYIIQSINEQ